MCIQLGKSQQLNVGGAPKFLVFLNATNDADRASCCQVSKGFVSLAQGGLLHRKPPCHRRQDHAPARQPGFEVQILFLHAEVTSFMYKCPATALRAEQCAAGASFDLSSRAGEHTAVSGLVLSQVPFAAFVGTSVDFMFLFKVHQARTKSNPDVVKIQQLGEPHSHLLPTDSINRVRVFCRQLSTPSWPTCCSSA